MYQNYYHSAVQPQQFNNMSYDRQFGISPLGAGLLGLGLGYLGGEILDGPGYGAFGYPVPRPGIGYGPYGPRPGFGYPFPAPGYPGIGFPGQGFGGPGFGYRPTNF